MLRFGPWPYEGKRTIVLTIAGTVTSATFRGKAPDPIDVMAEIPRGTVGLAIALFIVAERQSTTYDSVVAIDSLDLVSV